MAPENGMTCTVVTTENVDGTKSVDYQVDEGSLNNNNWQDDYVFDSKGNARHKYADYDIQQAIEQEEGYARPLQQSDFNMQGLMTPEDEQFIYEQVGGEAAYRELIGIAGKVLPDEQKHFFNAVLSSGDVENVLKMVTHMSNTLQKSGFGADNPSYDDVEFNEPQAVQQQSEPTYNVQQMQAIAGGSERYQQLIQLAAQNWTQEEIEGYDTIMQRGTADEVETAVMYLANQFQGY